MNNIIELPTKYSPVSEPIEGLKLPIQLKNHRGDVLAYIDYWHWDKKYHWNVEGVHQNYNRSFDTFIECFEDCFGALYQQMQEYRKVSEKHASLVEALKESLK